ncbi:MAG: sigma factor-like helix-turn-helix DNA-binding protein [Clostridium sp.]|uniref:sigma factor-like helix-turn-helix DNA-binding protein n=1 Tax=Clostridium sp. TaxID=1506 RepID=UPI003F328486
MNNTYKIVSLQIDEAKIESVWVHSETPREYIDNESRYIEKVEDKIFLKQCLDLLDEEELRVIKLRYGLDNDILKTQREVAHYLDVPQSYISRLEHKALRRIQQVMGNK